MIKENDMDIATKSKDLLIVLLNIAMTNVDEGKMANAMSDNAMTNADEGHEYGHDLNVHKIVASAIGSGNMNTESNGNNMSISGHGYVGSEYNKIDDSGMSMT